MEFGACYTFESAEQFWAELEDLLHPLDPHSSSLAEMDYAVRSYVALCGGFMDTYLLTPSSLDAALLLLLSSPVFLAHPQRLTGVIVDLIISEPASARDSGEKVEPSRVPVPVPVPVPEEEPPPHGQGQGQSASTLFITLMLILHLGMSNPLASSREILHSESHPSHPQKAGGGAGGGVRGSSSAARVYKALRAKWEKVIPVLMKWVWDADVVHEGAGGSAGAGAGESAGDGAGAGGGQEQGKELLMPAEGWEERVGTAATAVLYEVCRVQRLGKEELALFTYPFISHLFSLVERTREHEDETFNYTLIKLIIALNEQFMVASLPSSSSSSGGGAGDGGHGHGQGSLPPPILPTIAHGKGKGKGKGQGKGKGTEGSRAVGGAGGEIDRDEDLDLDLDLDDDLEGKNLVLECLRRKEGESKTFGENIIFILNRANGTPDSLCVSLLILKILYLLFTTSGTQEYFYTNDLCVLVDVFIRELCDLGEESEGLKHTYLRVLHPLLINTQLRLYPYKRPQLRRVLQSLVSNSHYRECDPTTRRLVERNLRGSWCEGLNDASVAEGEKRRSTRRRGSEGMGTGWSSGMGAARGIVAAAEEGLRGVSGNGMKERNASTLSVDAIAQAEDAGLAGVKGARGGGGGGGGAGEFTSGRPFVPPIVIADPSASSNNTVLSSSPLSSSATLEPVLEGRPFLPQISDSPPTTSPSSLSSSIELPRRRRPPPPPSSSSTSAPPSRPLTPAHLASTFAVGHQAVSTINAGGPPASGGRRAAPAPPTRERERERERADECRRVGGEEGERLARRMEEEMRVKLGGMRVDL